MSFPDYAEHDGLGLARLVRDGDVSAAELVEAAIERIERNDGVVNAITHRAFDEARAAAAKPLVDGPFAGVPFIVKDFGIGVAGWPNTSGSRFCRDIVDEADTGLMRRYRESGVIPIARGASSEYGIIGNVETAAYGAVRNPWNPDHIAGGSSGGSAAAVAAGYVPVAHASDGLGSIRIPAACCGLVGLKVTRDRNPNLPDGFDYAMGFCVDHVVTRSVRDSAAMLDVTGVPEAGSPYAIPAKAGPYLDEVTREPGRLRIAWSGQTPRGGGPGPEVQAALGRTAALLASLGHDVVEQPLGVDQIAIHAARAPVSAANFAAGMARVIARVGREPEPGELEPLTLAALHGSRAVTGEAAFRGFQELRMLCRSVVERFDTFDVFLSPVMTAPPPPIGTISGADGDPADIVKKQAALFPYAALFNFTGQPSLSLPLEMSPDDLPIGMMFTARYADEATLFRLAGQLEREQPWSGRRPAIWN
ncbi:amidase family protein [Sphingomonas sp. SUN019]|uniref:amidase n=1 Tax=Sphingomonas sp. SUN019 TaxID=2937788 RepID=UPI0021643014|nr:amidase family protein [Sphingomonas sp. SUN019]UVO50578.1 amidase family protein [Sphingomonas sp. SUN019]